jgi:hypothetical protein
MSNDSSVFEIVCPHCHTTIWVDSATRSVIRSEKGAAKPKSSLDELLEKEHVRRQGFGQKFEATAELEKQKRQKAKEKYEKAMSDKDLLKKDEEPGD